MARKHLQPSIFEESILPAGFFHLKNYLTESEQIETVAACRELLVSHPLVTPATPFGNPLTVRTSSWGIAGWSTVPGADQYSPGKYVYAERHENGKRYPPIPMFIKDRMNIAASDCGFEIELETVLMNWYAGSQAKLGRHQDNTEIDLTAPIVTFSIGESCVFNIGSTDKQDRGVDIEIKSGDAFVMGGASRLAYHAVKKLVGGRSAALPNGGRISLTGRQIYAAK